MARVTPSLTLKYAVINRVAMRSEPAPYFYLYAFSQIDIESELEAGLRRCLYAYAYFKTIQL